MFFDYYKKGQKDSFNLCKANKNKQQAQILCGLFKNMRCPGLVNNNG